MCDLHEVENEVENEGERERRESRRAQCQTSFHDQLNDSPGRYFRWECHSNIAWESRRDRSERFLEKEYHFTDSISISIACVNINEFLSIRSWKAL